jgi:hypothetical protein
MGIKGLIVFQGNFEIIYVYRHWDAKPEIVFKDLEIFMQEVNKNQIEGNFSIENKNTSNIVTAFINRFPDSNYQPVGRISSNIDYLYFVFATYESKNEIIEAIITKELCNV